MNLDVQTWTGKKIKALQITTLHYIFHERTIGRLLPQSLGYASEQVVLLGFGLFFFLIWKGGYFVFKETLGKNEKMEMNI